MITGFDWAYSEAKKFETKNEGFEVVGVYRRHGRWFAEVTNDRLPNWDPETNVFTTLSADLGNPPDESIGSVES